MSVLTCGRCALQAVCDLGGADSRLRTERVNYLEMAKEERKASGGRVASGKYGRRKENYSSSQYPPSPARCPAKRRLLVAYMDSRFGISRA